jgi:Raf kinase inhibitor-like YbhB/YbcL family protein
MPRGWVGSAKRLATRSRRFPLGLKTLPARRRTRCRGKTALPRTRRHGSPRRARGLWGVTQRSRRRHGLGHEPRARGDAVRRRREDPATVTCDGGDTNPELTVSGVVDAAETLAIVVEDLDADDYVHWTLWNVPADIGTIPRSVAKREQPPFAEGARQGENDAGGIGYVGPCPPESDDPHSYRFRLSAVSTTLDLAGGASRDELADALSGNVIDSTSLTAQYDRN